VGETVKLVGPGLLVLVGLGVLIWATSAYVGVDSLRRRPSDYAGVPEGRWFYAVPQFFFFFVAFFAWQVPFVQQEVPWIGNLLIVTPFVLAQQMAYLLRVVFPTRNRLELRLAAEGRTVECADEASAEDDGFHHPEDEHAAVSDEDDGFFDDSDDRSS